MGNLYETISMLCEGHGITGYRLCKDIGIQPSILTDLKSGRKKGLSAQIANKIATYFDVSVGYLLGEEELGSTKEAERDPLDDIKFALFGDVEIDDAVLDDVRAYARFKAEQAKKKGKKGQEG